MYCWYTLCYTSQLKWWLYVAVLCRNQTSVHCVFLFCDFPELDSTRRRFGALDWSSEMQLPQLNSGNLSTLIFRNSEGELYWHSFEASWSIASSTFSMISSFNPSWESTALAIVGKCPPASDRPRYESPMSSSLVNGSTRDGVDTVTCWQIY